VTESRWQVAGGRKQEAGSRKQEAGRKVLVTGYVVRGGYILVVG